MIRAIILGTLALALAFVFSLFFNAPAFAAGGLHPRCNVDWPCQVSGSKEISIRANKTGHKSSFFASEEITPKQARRVARADRFRNVEFGSPMYPPETQRSFLRGVSTPARFVGGRLKCAVNIGVALAERGIRGTGSPSAKSYLHWGRPSGPQPGAVAVFSRGRRGGHVAIVQNVRPDGTVIYLNPSSRRQAWQVGPYNRRPIAFRVAGE